MLSLLKKKPDAAAANLTPAWHPNFRNFERLPDTKVVRTTFFVNGGAIAVALVLLVYTGNRELNLHAVNSQIEEVEAQIVRDKPASDKAVSLFTKFKAEEAQLNEVDAFIKSRPIVSDLLLRIGQTLPANVALDYFDLRENILILRGTVRGAPDMASGYASTYVEQLRVDPVLVLKIDDVVLKNLNRIPITGRLAIEIELKLKGAAKK
ncbi:MAG: hypothetical protein IPN11_05575 [Opitutaceae bacterium]|nr:hypothetical protein [Opitutaceae bacterium]